MFIEGELLEYSLNLLKYVGQHPQYFGINQKVGAAALITAFSTMTLLSVIGIRDVRMSKPILLARKTEGIMTVAHVSKK